MQYTFGLIIALRFEREEEENTSDDDDKYDDFVVKMIL